MATFILTDPRPKTEDCLGRITVGSTRSKSLTIVVSPLDMIRLIGMAQVLATLAYGVKGLRRGISTWDWPFVLSWRPTTREQQPNGTMVTQSSPHVDSPPPSPLPTDTTIPTINLSRTHDIESSQQKHPTLTGWLVIDMQCVTSAQSPEKARIIVCQHRIYHLMESSCLHTQLITHLAPHMFAFRQACIMHAVDEYCSKWPNQEVTPLPDIYFFDGWRVRPCMKIPTNLSRE